MDPDIYEKSLTDTVGLISVMDMYTRFADTLYKKFHYMVVGKNHPTLFEKEDLKNVFKSFAIATHVPLFAKEGLGVITSLHKTPLHAHLTQT